MIDSSDAEWVYRYSSAPKTRENLRGASREMVRAQLMSAINSQNTDVRHIAAFLLKVDYPDILSECSDDERRTVNGEHSFNGCD
jgi:hypothetical protein